jgi:hypothetical protein
VNEMPALVLAVLFILGLLSLIGAFFGWLILEDPDCRPYKRLTLLALLGCWTVYRVAGPLFDRGS